MPPSCSWTAQTDRSFQTFASTWSRLELDPSRSASVHVSRSVVKADAWRPQGPLPPLPAFWRSLLAEGHRGREGTLRSCRHSRNYSCSHWCCRQNGGWIHQKMIKAAQKDPQAQTGVLLF